MTKIVADVVHVTAGFLSAVATFINPTAGILMTILFIVYQLDEDWHMKNGAWRDILEYSIGYYAGVLVKILNISICI